MTRTDSTRGQTTLDFAVGISVFLITSVFVFAFVPGLLQPFNEGAQEETVGADRLASQLTESMLAPADEPYVLNVTCTTEFFRPDASGGPVADGACAFNQSTDLDDPAGLTDRVGVSPRQRLNVTIRSLAADQPLQCSDGAGAVVNASDGSCAVPFAAGDDPPAGSSSVVTASRTVAAEDEDARLTVRMW